MDRTGDKSVVCWQPHGRAFMVHKPKEFVQQVMPHFFNQTKYASFQRQLNLYGFSRLTHGPDKGAYYHGCFVRGERNLCRGMVRQKIKGTKVRRSLAPDEEPNFYSSHYNNNIAMSGVTSDDMSSSSSRNPDMMQSSTQVTPDQSPRMLTIQPHNALVSLMPSIPAPLTPTRLTNCRPGISSDMKDTKLPSSGSSGPDIPRTVSPHQNFSVYRLKDNPTSTQKSSLALKGGDLLFFEGQPFRYLEHLEELPPAPTFPQTKDLLQNVATPPTILRRNSKSTTHDMISNVVVCCDPPSFQQSEYTTPRQNICSV